ncbi:endopeptidase La [Flavobacteriaceae bacterium]|nr:endopeptidase La [Flavobacteriaceae bacterium]
MSKAKLISLDDLSLEELEVDAELIPLMTTDDEEEILKEPVPKVIPILPLRNTVLFPGVVIPITATRDKSIQLIRDANASNKLIGVVAQLDSKVQSPEQKDLHKVGTLARILRVLQMPDGNTTIILQGKKRFQIEKFIESPSYMRATVTELQDVRPDKGDKKFAAVIDSIKDLSLQIIADSPNIPSEASFAINNIKSDSFLVNFVSSNMSMASVDKQKILESNDLHKRALLCLKHMDVEFQKLSLKNEVQSKVRNDLDQQQREYFLHQQMKAIQEELGGSSSHKDVADMKIRSREKKWSKKVKSHFEKELLKLERMNSQVAEYGVQRNYLELLLDLPWDEFSKDNFDLKRAQRILDRDHFGLEKVKKRVIEFLAVLKLRNDMKSPILCLTGPPGVGKTSLGKSIAEALGREYVRISLGGMRDEAEIRGHRKTYIGAMPGRILQNIKKAGTSNPVFVLDEIDKLSSGASGDPSSALLEVLDPEQNSEFYDNFLEFGYDLSKVLFIATSNTLSTIQPALLDRMEIIQVSGYTLEEKIAIGKKYLIPKQINEHGLTANNIKIGKSVLKKIVSGYTRESGVRGLDKTIAKVIRNRAKSIAMEETFEALVDTKHIEDILGAEKVSKAAYENNDVPGVVTGLAWTQMGGDILFIESLVTKGSGKLSMTGNLGKVMKESATIALEFIKSYADQLGTNSEELNKSNYHIHVPEGATPKDGPSAGITMLTSLVSSITGRKVKSKIAMSGEITLRGKVLAVGGIKEKILAAKRANVKTIILCAENKKDVDEINQSYLRGLQFHYVSSMIDVLDFALTTQKATKELRKIK